MEIQLEPGDTVIVFTDGVTEAMNAEQEQYGNERILKVLSSGPSDPESLTTRLLDDIGKHVAGYKQSDDLTLVSFGVV